MKIDAADSVFSQYIRLRDMRCMRCGSQVQLNDKGLPVTHQNSHYLGRTREGTRFEPDNCDTLCHGCHRYWEKEDREGYRQFKVNQLGQERYDSLTIQAQTYCKKDRKMSLLISRELLKTLL